MDIRFGGNGETTRNQGKRRRDGKHSNKLNTHLQLLKVVRAYRYLVIMYMQMGLKEQEEKGLKIDELHKIACILMQSSALHLPRCIDAIYESRNVLRAKILPHLSLTTWTSNETSGSKLA